MFFLSFSLIQPNRRIFSLTFFEANCRLICIMVVDARLLSMGFGSIIIICRCRLLLEMDRRIFVSVYGISWLLRFCPCCYRSTFYEIGFTIVLDLSNIDWTCYLRLYYGSMISRCYYVSNFYLSYCFEEFRSFESNLIKL